MQSDKMQDEKSITIETSGKAKYFNFRSYHTNNDSFRLFIFLNFFIALHFSVFFSHYFRYRLMLHTNAISMRSKID